MIYLYKERCKHRQYIPSKLAKYGLKFWVLADAKTYYCYNSAFYGGKSDRIGLSLGKHVISKLANCFKSSSRNVITDNYFTNIKLVKELKQRGITLVGIIKSNKIELPVGLFNHMNSPLYSINFLFT